MDFIRHVSSKSTIEMHDFHDTLKCAICCVKHTSLLFESWSLWQFECLLKKCMIAPFYTVSKPSYLQKKHECHQYVVFSYTRNDSMHRFHMDLQNSSVLFEENDKYVLLWKVIYCCLNATLLNYLRFGRKALFMRVLLVPTGYLFYWDNFF